MPDHSANLNLMSKAVITVGDILYRDFEEIQRLQSSLDGAGRLTKKALIRANYKLVDELSEARPDYGIESTLTGEVVGKDTTRKWLVSPISGLQNFTRGNSNWVISLGLQFKGETVIGVIYYPLGNELYKVIKGDGAYARQVKLRVAPIQNVKDFVVAIDFQFRAKKNNPNDLARLINSFAEVKSTGAPSLDLIYLASGFIDGTIAPEVNPIDIAPAKLLLIESGGLTAPFNQSGGIIGSGFKGFENFRDLVRDHFE